MRNLLFTLFIIGLTFFSITGCDQSMTKPTMETVILVKMTPMDDPEGFAVAFVDKAIEFYKMEGRESAITAYNDPTNVKGQWYVFIMDDNDLMVSHAVLPELIGSDVKDIVSFGYPLGIEIAKATEEGHWVDYLAHNPAANKLEQKRTWVIRHDGYIFGTGYYEPWAPDPATLPPVSKDDPEAFTYAFVQEAIARYEFSGVEATATYYNDPANVDGQWYILITDASDLYVAHPLRPDFIGSDIKDIPGLDGSPVGAEIAKATGAGRWIEYAWHNPESGDVELKRTWAVRHDGYLFGSGYYEPMMGDTEPETY